MGKPKVLRHTAHMQNPTIAFPMHQPFVNAFIQTERVQRTSATGESSRCKQKAKFTKVTYAHRHMREHERIIYARNVDTNTNTTQSVSDRLLSGAMAGDSLLHLEGIFETIVKQRPG